MPVQESNIASQTDQTCSHEVEGGEPIIAVPSAKNTSSNGSAKKKPIDHAKNSMRKASVHELLKLSTWINGRLSQRLDAQPILS